VDAHGTYIVSLSSLSDDEHILSNHEIPEELPLAGVRPETYAAPVDPHWSLIAVTE
jgi:hypothetical protein